MLKDKIKSLCTNRGITVMKLESDLGFGGGTIARWDAASPKAENLAKVADYFNVSVDYLLDRCTLEEGDKAIKELVELYSQLSPDDQDMIKKLASHMAAAKR